MNFGFLNHLLVKVFKYCIQVTMDVYWHIYKIYELQDRRLTLYFFYITTFHPTLLNSHFHMRVHFSRSNKKVLPEFAFLPIKYYI